MLHIRSMMTKNLVLIVLLLLSNAAYGADYYIAPSGNDINKGTNCADAKKTFSAALSLLSAGDTLWLCDGKYSYNKNGNVVVPSSGNSGSYINIKAINDGAATVDAGGSARALIINYKEYINIEGIIFRNSGPNASGGSSVIEVSNSRYINFRRVSSYDAAATNNHQFLIYYSSYVLLEDCVAAGFGRDLINLQGSSYITVRRCYVRYSNSSSDSAAIVAYHADNSIIENNVVVIPNIGSYSCDGFLVWSNTANRGDHNKFYGNVAIGYGSKMTLGFGVGSRTNYYQRTGNDFRNNVSIGSYSSALKNEGDNSMTVLNNTFVLDNAQNYGINFSRFGGSVSVAGTIKNNSIKTFVYGLYIYNNASHSGTNTYNSFYGNSNNYSGKALSGAGDIDINPSYGTAMYGKGAYLMVPIGLIGKGENGANIGAEVLYRYKDGSPTTIPLWPWPMEDRIYRETQVSVTWEAIGGLWKTLDGVYLTPPPPPPPPPPAPTPVPGAPALIP